jgi:hypothetical protein
MNILTENDIRIIVTPGSITVNYSGQTHTVLKEDPRYEKVKTALKERRKLDIPAIVMSPVDRINEYGDGKIKAENGVIQVEIDGEMRTVPTRLAGKILEHQAENLPIEGLMAFAANLLQNPSWHANQQLFDFLEVNNHPITDDGRFVAYKKVRPDFKDLHSRTFDNSPGMKVKMHRNDVDEDPNRTCSNGLHVANWDYAKNKYGGQNDTMLEVLVNPKDVVAVPTDYNQSKMRVCEYEVLGVVANPTEDKYRSVKPSSVAAPPEDPSQRDTDDHEEEEEEEHEDTEGQLPLKQFCPSCGVSLKEVEGGDEDHKWNCAEGGIGADAIADYEQLKDDFGETTAVNAIAEKYGMESAERLPDWEDHIRG